jgi:hypothetical protein
MAAAASSLKNQAEDLVQVVSVFRLGDDGGGRTAAGVLRIQELQRHIALALPA